jgi:undecaprenyl-diphosphatase
VRALLAFEARTSLALSRAGVRPRLRRPFVLASRLGDGWVWGALAAGFALFGGASGWIVAVRMLACGACCTLVYAALKRTTRRARPCHRLRGCRAWERPLDEFSFPSGHTMHAVCFTALAVDACPALAWLLVPFAALVAASRLVLGLHYVSDVVAGAVLGGVVAVLAAS